MPESPAEGSKDPEEQEPTEVEAYYRKLHTNCGVSLEALLESDHSAELARVHAFASDLWDWADVLNDRTEHPLLKVAHREYQHAALALSMGLYTLSFVGLRLTLELSLAAVYLSGREVELRHWLGGRRDTSWAAISSKDTGVFSKSFVEAFSPVLLGTEDSFRDVAVATYRECSQHVHGNIGRTQPVPDTVSFDADAFGVWTDLCEGVRTCVLYALTARYFIDLPVASRSRVEATVLEEIGGAESVRALIESPTSV